jgi:hypothetical protein
MQKIGKLAQSRDDIRPHRVSGALTTSLHEPPPIDLPKLFAAPLAGATITGSAHVGPEAIQDRSRYDGVLLLSDGTHITFVTIPMVATP